MSRSGSDRELGDRLLQIYDEVKSHPLRKRRGHEVCESVSDVLLGTARGADVVSFSVDAKRYTFRCFDFFISGLGGGLCSVRLGLFDEHGRQLFGGTIPGGEIEVLNPGEWVEDFTRLHQRIAALIRERRIRDPYGLENLDAVVEGKTEEECNDD